ncbi:trace amine-associated receptor 1-like [Sardina pilchardus]|uniref:trace amine-associated receptor 1-like n=1 Tax=Sardina pilchardus TaxID=27697 RepID=UPI002E14238D
MKLEENSVQFCFPLHNSSCVKDWRSFMEYIIMYTFLSTVSGLTVFFNLLVIISISHFKQLHTPTNLLILSLAVADLLTGLIVIPVEGLAFIETCWYFGDYFCTVFPIMMFTIFSGSHISIFLISLDRYIAVTDPFHYTVKVTFKRAVFCVSFGWFSSFIYALAILNKRQAKIINTVTVRIKPEGKGTVPKTSETKAAKTLGVVIAVYFICWIPYFIGSLIADSVPYNSAVFVFMYWLLYTNSCMNPLMYALFYPWFRISVKHILTLSMFNSSSSYLNVFPERK